MSQFTIPGTSVTYSNPKQVDQNTLVFSSGSPYPILNGAAGSWVPVVAGSPWQPNLVPANPGLALAIPQPGTFDASPPNAPPIAVNTPPVPASDPAVGGRTIPGTTSSWKNPA
jgi:hypothetical protein